LSAYITSHVADTSGFSSPIAYGNGVLVGLATYLYADKLMPQLLRLNTST